MGGERGAPERSGAHTSQLLVHEDSASIGETEARLMAESRSGGRMFFCCPRRFGAPLECTAGRRGRDNAQSQTPKPTSPWRLRTVLRADRSSRGSFVPRAFALLFLS